MKPDRKRCDVRGCRTVVTARGLCISHYLKRYRANDWEGAERITETKLGNNARSLALQLRFEGRTYEEIGKVLRVSRQRVQQILSPSNELRALVLLRAKCRCEDCGISGTTTRLHIHHRKATGLAVDTYNELENLCSLCMSCHRKAHGFDGWKP